MRIATRPRWTLALVTALSVAVAVATLPLYRSGADEQIETAFTGEAPCPLGHCNQHLDGREGMPDNDGTILTLTVSTPPTLSAIALYTPTPAIAFNASLGCTVGQVSTQSAPDQVACAGTQPTNAGGSAGPFLYAFTATGTTTPTLDLNWRSLAYTSTQSQTCTVPGVTQFGMDEYVVQGAPLHSDVGNIYVSDDNSIAKFTPNGSNGTGVCAWAWANPAGAAMISWNAVYLPPTPGGFPGNYYAVGQGTAGPVVLATLKDGLPLQTLVLTETGGWDVTYNTLSAVQTPGGVRLYTSTALCPTDGGCNQFAYASGRLYAIDITSPITIGAAPSMTVAYSYTFTGPSGASPMVITPTAGAPLSDTIYFDGSVCVAACSSPNRTLNPVLYGLRDNCPFGSVCTTGATSPTVVMDTNFATLGEDGYCPDGGSQVYRGIQAAAALEGPEQGGADPHSSVWAFAACGSTLYRFDAWTGAPWTGAGAITIDISDVTGLKDYVPTSTMETVIDANTGDTTMFVGAGTAPPGFSSYVTALDLETGKMFWKVEGPTAVGDPRDTPFNGQFPIAQTAQGGNVLIAVTSGKVDGSTILAIPLS